MKSARTRCGSGSSCLWNGSKRPGWLPVVLAIAACIPAGGQPMAGNIATHSVLISGPSAVDGAGNVYATTSIIPPAMTTSGAAQTQPGGGTCYITIPFSSYPSPCYNAYIAKSDPSGSTVFATYLGGASNSNGQAIAVDGAGNVYVAGTTGNSFPTTAHAAIPTSGGNATFAAKLGADGSKFLYSTFLPAALATVNAIAVDAQGNAYIVGATSTEYIPADGIGMHACVIKLSADGSTVVYTAVLSGSNQESAVAVSADASGFAYVTGFTNSPDFPATAGAVQPQLAGVRNAFVTKLDPSGSISYSTFLGGSGKDGGAAVQADASGNAYVAGTTTSLDFPTTSGSVEPDPLIPAWSNTPTGFVAKIAPDGKSLVYASYFAAPVALALGASNDVYLAGGTGPAGIPITPSAPMPCAPGGPESAGGDFVAHLNADGALVDATYVNFDATAPMGFGLTTNGSAVMAVFGRAAQVNFGAPGWTAAPCMTLSALNAATLDPTPVVPGEFVTFVGFGIGPESGVSAAASAQGTPLSLGGVQVLFDGKPAPLIYAQSEQVNAQAPFELNGQTSTTITLTYGGNTFGPVTVPLRFAYPGLFRMQAGVTAQAMAENADGSINSPSNPAPRGSVVTLWGTGFPPLNSGCTTGGVNVDSPVNLAAGYTAVLSGGGTVTYAGGAPLLACGVVQIDMQVPADAVPGPLLLTPGACTNGGNTCTGPQTGSILYVK